MKIGNSDGRSALHLAAAEGNIQCVKFLLKTCKVNFDCKDRWGHTPLSEAIDFKHDNVAEYLKNHEAEVKGDARKEVKTKDLWKKLSISQRFLEIPKMSALDMPNSK